MLGEWKVPFILGWRHVASRGRGGSWERSRAWQTWSQGKRDSTNESWSQTLRKTWNKGNWAGKHVILYSGLFFQSPVQFPGRTRQRRSGQSWPALL